MFENEHNLTRQQQIYNLKESEKRINKTTTTTSSITTKMRLITTGMSIYHIISIRAAKFKRFKESTKKRRD